jgi:pimeloyl-ACP methyl ester carboxylesterase
VVNIATVNRVSVAYDDVGHGTPVVLVHGHPFDRSMWAPQVAALTGPAREESARGESAPGESAPGESAPGESARVIVADLRGYGASAPGDGTTWESFARDVEGLLDHLRLDRVVLGGLSMGGQIVQECYRLFPDRIGALVLADTTARAETDAGRRARLAMAERLLREGMRGYADENLARMLAPYNVAALPTVAAHVHAMMTATSPRAAAAALRARATRPDYRELLTRVTVPTLVVVGRDDEFTPVAEAEAMCRLLPDATLAVIDGAGHLPTLERPGAVDEALRSFLDRLAPMSAR